MIRLYSIQEESDPRSNIYEDGDGGNIYGTNDTISKCRNEKSQEV